MDGLLEKTSSLIADYLVKSNREYRDKYNHQRLATFLFDVLDTESIDKIFDFENEGYATSIALSKYKSKLDLILQNIDEHYISWNRQDKKKVFERVIEIYFNRISDEIEASTTARESLILKNRIIDLEAQLEFGKPAESVNFWDKLSVRVNLPYLIILCLSAILIGGLTLIGLTADMTVNVEFNIGEILGALLIGTGVAAAGVSYATKDRPIDNDRNEG